MADQPTRTFLIWSRYHNAWFRDKAAGYTSHIAAAGVFDGPYAIERTRESKVYLSAAREKIAQRRTELIKELAALDSIEAQLTPKKAER